MKPMQPKVKDELSIEQLMDHKHGPLPKRRLVNLLLEEERLKHDGVEQVNFFHAEQGSF